MSDLKEITSDENKMLLINATRALTLASIEPAVDYHHVTDAKNLLEKWLDNYYNTPIMKKHGAKAMDKDAEIA